MTSPLFVFTALVSASFVSFSRASRGNLRKVNTNYEILCFDALKCYIELLLLVILPFNLAGMRWDRNRRQRIAIPADLKDLKSSICQDIQFPIYV
jgi:hypothetical protein